MKPVPAPSLPGRRLWGCAMRTLLLVAICLAVGCVPRVRFRSPEAEAWAYVYVTSHPPGAAFTVEGAPTPMYGTGCGTTPGGVTIILPEPGRSVRVTVRCAKEGYVPATCKLDFPAERRAHLRLFGPLSQPR